jgi:hypothetical protein
MIGVFGHFLINKVSIRAYLFDNYHSIRFIEACNVTMTIHINTISAINEVNMVRHIH